MKQLNGLTRIKRKYIYPDSNVVVINTNRWAPEKCMWTVEKIAMKQDVYIVFPFPEIWASVCHIIIGTSDSHMCFIHLTPLTSLFRSSTDELEKIMPNLGEITNNKGTWQFQIYYLPDNGDELKFRNLISEVLYKNEVSFSQLIPKGLIKGAWNLYYLSDCFFYSKQNITTITANNDISDIGFFNKFPIYSYE